MYFGNNSQLPVMVPTGAVTPSPALVDLIQSFPYIDKQTSALLSKDISLFRQIFPSAKQRMIIAMKEDANANSLRTLFKLQDLILQEESNDRLIRCAAIIRADTLKLAQDKLVEVSEELSRNQQRLITAFQKDIDFCNNIKSSLLKKKYQEALAGLIEEAFDTFDRLSKHFNQFLDARIGTPSPSTV